MTDTEMLARLRAPEGNADVVLDTDAYNEIDDQFAIAYLIAQRRFDILGIHAAPFHNERSASPGDGMERSYNEIIRILRFAGRGELIPVVRRGSTSFMADDKTGVPSSACNALVELARQHTPENPLWVVSIGALTNVASALLAAPDIAPRITLVWLGGNALHMPDTREFNMMQDVHAVRAAFASGVPLVRLPCIGVVDRFYTTAPELRFWLSGKTPLSNYLAENTISAAEQYAASKPWSRVIWDVTAVAWLCDREGRFTDSVITQRTLPTTDYTWEAPCCGIMRTVTYVKRDALFSDMVDKLIK